MGRQRHQMNIVQHGTISQPLPELHCVHNDYKKVWIICNNCVDVS